MKIREYKIVALILVVLIMVTSIPFGQTAVIQANDLGEPWDGEMVQMPEKIGNEYQIVSASELAWFAKEVNNGNDFEGKSIYITGNINLNQKEWFVIGNGTSDKPSKINADIYIENANISGLKITDSNISVKGLFGAVCVGNVSINNLKMEEINIGDEGRHYDGFLFGSIELKKNSKCEINNCTLDGVVSGTSQCGAIAGNVQANNQNSVISISDCDVNISSTSYKLYIGDKVNSECKGGVIGRYHSAAKTKLILNGIQCNVDLASYNESGYGETCAGGMIGILNGTTKVYVYQCAVTGTILSSGYRGWSGGIIGKMESCDSYKQSDCYVTAEITSKWNAYGYPYNAAGFIGGITEKKPQGFIRNSYFAGKSGSAVGFIAKDRLGSDTQLKAYNSYYDSNKVLNHLFHTDYFCYPVNGTTVDCVAYTTEQMAIQNNFVNWDFDNIWIMDDGCPKLRLSDFSLPEDFEVIENTGDDSLVKYLDKVLTCKGNVSSIKYLAQDENFLNSAFVYENDTKFSTEVTMLLSNMIYRGVDGWKDLFNGETSKQQAEEVIAKLLYNYQDECDEVSTAKTIQEFSSTLTSGLEDFLQTGAVIDGISNEDIKSLYEVLSPQVLEEIFKDHKYNYIEDYLTIVKGYSENDNIVKLFDSYLGSAELLKAYKDNFKYLGAGVEIISLTNDTISKLVELDVLYNSDELYSEMLLYLKENCKYEIVCQAAEELYSVITDSYEKQIQYVADTLMNKLEEKVVDFTIDKMLETTIANLNYAFIIKEGFDWGIKIANWTFHTGEIQETRDKMRSLAYIGNCLAQWMLESNIAYFRAGTNEEKQELGLKTYYAAYMLWQTRIAGEDALQGYAELQAVTFRRYYEISKSISETLDSLKKTLFIEDNNSKLLTIVVACPVDVEILDTGENVIEKIVDGCEKEYESNDVDYSVVYDVVSDDYIKIIRLNKAKEYKIKCIGNELGQVDISLMQITEEGNIKTRYIDDISVESKSIVEFTSSFDNRQVLANNGNETKVYDLLDGDGTYIPLQNISLAKNQIEICKGEKIRLAKSIIPSNASDQMLYWKTNNKSCVDVNSDGIIEGISVGSAIISVSSIDGIIQDSCVVTVKEGNTSISGGDSGESIGDRGNASTNDNNASGRNDGETNENKYNIVIPSKKLAAGKKVKLSIEKENKEIDNTSIVWSSSNKEYATVSKLGIVSCKKKGIGKNVVITAESADGGTKLASVTITIMKHAVTNVKIRNAPKKLAVGEKVKLDPVISTTGKSANTILNWTSSNPKYANVNSKGKVIAKKAGKGKTVIITAKSTDGSNKKCSIKIKIK